jgi:YfiH family protein
MLPPPFRWQDDHLIIDLPGARAMFTTRRGGHSTGPFASLNLGRLTRDDPDAVTLNRKLVQDAADGQLAMIRQVHGRRVIRLADADAASGPEPRWELEEADGQATAQGRIAPIVLTADCLPIAIGGGGAVAMLHAGWRGLADGIIAEGVRAIRELGDERAPLAAAIGPGAGPCCYEVGDEVHARFSEFGGRGRRGRMLDMKAIARQQLLGAGIDDVHDSGLCTICSPPTLFFSHRRDDGVTGRQGGLVWLS